MRSRKCLLIALAAVLMAAPEAWAGLVLTGASEFSTSSTGSFQSPNRWNTAPGDPWFNIYFTAPNTGMSGAFLNSGNGPSTNLDFGLTPGTYQFFMFADPGQPASFEALNLFFDGGSNPAISVFAPEMDSATAPAFSANANPNTLALDGSTVVAGSGTLSATLDGLNVTLTGYSWAEPSVYGLDRVGQFATGPDGQNDFVGSVTLTVAAASVPEPSSVILLGVGIAAAGLAAKRLSGRGRRVRCG